MKNSVVLKSFQVFDDAKLFRILFLEPENNCILWMSNFIFFFLSETTIEDRSECAKHTSGNNLISPDTDYRVGSSFELSPSDSSDGTYMWDEEGLEPIGNVHPVGSYESSEMNSIVCMNSYPLLEHFISYRLVIWNLLKKLEINSEV